jgi:carbon-monoxide dehydrogenase medium subunit
VLGGFSYHRPASVEELDDVLAAYGSDARLLAGGTDLLVQMRSGRQRPSHVVDLAGVPGLSSIDEQDGALVIGANVRVSAAGAHAASRAALGDLAEGCAKVGSVQIQNRATVAGNICNASPAADTVPALVAHRAEVVCAGAGASRTVAVEDFVTGPGQIALGEGEWVSSIRIPTQSAPSGSCYLKLGRTRGVDIALVGVACHMTLAETRLALASVAARPIAVDVNGEPSAELPPEAAAEIEERVRPIGDVRASADYRRAMTLVLVQRAWRVAFERLHAGTWAA